MFNHEYFTFTNEIRKISHKRYFYDDFIDKLL